MFTGIVEGTGTVEPRPVETGRRVDGEIVVLRGVAGGERVVTDGHLRLVPGAKVDIKAAES